MDKKSTCAVLLSYYNGGPFFSKQLDSLADQDFNDFDLIVRNDGSDSSVLDEAMNSRSGERLNFDVISGDNVGFARSFLLLNNYAFSKGYKYYSFCDQDDVWTPGKMKQAYDFLSAQDDGVTPLLYICGADLIDGDGNNIGAFDMPTDIDSGRAIFENYYPGHLMVYNQSLAKLLTMVNPDRILCHDWLALLFARLGGRVKINPRSIGVHYRQHGKNHLGAPSLSSTLKRKFSGVLKFDKQKPMISSQLDEVYSVLKLSKCISHESDMPLIFLKNRGFLARIKNLLLGRVTRAGRIDSMVLRLQYFFGIW